MGVSQNHGYLFAGPYNMDYSILESILGSPYFGKFPYEVRGKMAPVMENRENLTINSGLGPCSVEA